MLGTQYTINIAVIIISKGQVHGLGTWKLFLPQANFVPWRLSWWSWSQDKGVAEQLWVEWWHESTQNSWEQEGMDLFGMDLGWTSEPSVVVAVRDTLHHACYFFVAGTELKLFLVQTGVTSKAKQRSRAAVRRIQAGVGLVPGPAACNREEPCTTVTHPPPLVQLLGRRKETSIFPPPLCT